MYEELRKRRIDVCCPQEVRWRRQEVWLMDVKGRRYKLWCSGNMGGVGILEVRRKSDRVMTVVTVLEEEMVRMKCVYVPQSGRRGAEKGHFYDDLRSEWDLHSVGELVLGMGGFNGHVGKGIKGYEGVQEGNGIGERNVEGKMLPES